LTICAIISGWLVVSTSPLPVPTRFFDLFVIPNIVRPDPSLFADAALAHRLAAWGIAFLIALHVAGALKHHFVDGDDVLKRMLPRWRSQPAARLKSPLWESKARQRSVCCVSTSLLLVQSSFRRTSNRLEAELGN
jgi:hypothetical protein